jgi:methionyl-tRNA synthetase
MSKSFYVTTAIEYVNSYPHVGHAYEKIGADIIARAMRMRGYDVIFQMGTDEHSTNVARKAEELGLSPEKFCNEMVEKFVAVWEKLELSYDVFIRTTSARHVATVRALLERIHANGDIFIGKYEGYYCDSCERFYQTKDLLRDGAAYNCPVHELPCEWLEEENYFFRLSRYRDPLLKHLEEHPGFIEPEIRRNEILNVLREGLEDISISRSGSMWGVPLPWDEKAVTYVWFDALINYVSAVGYSDDEPAFKKYWPAKLQIIGKDITRFHCIYWPAMLLSAGLPLPETIFGHGFVHFRGEKMSKTRGTVIDPLEIVDKHGADALRYYLAKEIHWGQDGDFTPERFVDIYNADLANNLGNLVNRSLTMIRKYCDGQVEAPADPSAGAGQVFDLSLRDRYLAGLDAWRLHELPDCLIRMVDGVNLYIDRSQPWALNKDPEARGRLQEVMFNIAEALRWIAVCAFPIIPGAAGKIWEQLNLPGRIEETRFDDLEWGRFPEGVVVNKPEPIFPRIMPEDS